MFGKRLGGFILGLLLGLIPLLNAFVCVVFAFIQKKKGLGIFSIVMGIAMAVSLIMTEAGNNSHKNIGDMLFGVGYLGCLVMSIILGLRAFVTAEDLAAAGKRNTAPAFIPDETIVPDVNINTAGENELTRLPGINLILAKAIVGERNRNGYFSDVYDLEQRMGFTPEQMSNLILIASFGVAERNHPPERTPGRRAEPDKKDDKGKDSGTGKGRVIEF